MPHLTIEYSANLESRGDLPGLCLTLRGALLATGLFEEGAVRVRAIPCPHYAVADLLPENAFAALLLRIGAGRSAEEKKRLGNFPVGQGLFFAGQNHVHIQVIASPRETELITTNPQEVARQEMQTAPGENSPQINQYNPGQY